MAAQSPCRQLVGVASSSSDILGLNTVSGEVSQIVRVDLHGADVARAVSVLAVKARLAVLQLGDGKHDVGGDIVFDGSLDRTDHPFLHGGWYVSEYHG